MRILCRSLFSRDKTAAWFIDTVCVSIHKHPRFRSGSTGATKKPLSQHGALQAGAGGRTPLQEQHTPVLLLPPPISVWPLVEAAPTQQPSLRLCSAELQWEGSGVKAVGIPEKLIRSITHVYYGCSPTYPLFFSASDADMKAAAGASRGDERVALTVLPCAQGAFTSSSRAT